MNKLPLNDFHQSMGARFIDVRGWHIPAEYEDSLQELDAAQNKVALLDRSYLCKLKLRGADAVDLINRISTNDMAQLVMGSMVDTVFCTPKGRIIDYCRVIQHNDELILISSYIECKHLIEWINRFIILEDVEVEDVSADFLWLTLIGPDARAFVQDLCGSEVTDRDETIWIKKENIVFPALLNNNFKQPAYNFFLPNNPGTEIFKWFVERIRAYGGTLMGDHAFQIIRVESGMPDWGTELTEQYNPHEARLIHAVSFTKGCYTGQEVIARLDTYDKVQKYLMIVDLNEQLFAEPPFDVFYDDEKIGTLTSYAYNPLTEHSMGLAYIKKHYSVAEFNIEVEVNVKGHLVGGKLQIPPSHEAT